MISRMRRLICLVRGHRWYRDPTMRQVLAQLWGNPLGLTVPTYCRRCKKFAPRGEKATKLSGG